MTFVWETPPEDALDALFVAYVEAIVNGVYVIFQRQAPVIRNEMVAEAPWRDRTGNARQRLWTRPFIEGMSVVLELGHGVYYGFYLETKYGGVYAIVIPTMDKYAAILSQEIMRMLS